MATSQRQQAERNLNKHKNYIRFLKKYYKHVKDEAWYSGIVIRYIRALIKIERKKARK